MKKNNYINTGEKNAYQLLYALTSLYLVFPTLFFAYGWLRWPINAITISLIIFFIIIVLKDVYQILLYLQKNWLPYNPISKTLAWITPPFLVLIVWLTFSGVGGLGFQNGDYDLKNVLLRSLIIQKWPLSMVVEGHQVKLVYYLNYYLPAAVVGKLLGWLEANAFMFIWSLVGVVLAFIWFVIISQISLKPKKVSRLLYLALIFCLAGGLDYIGAYIIKDMPFSLTRHIDNWAWHMQYSSNSTLIYWVPQHAIPAWLLTGMVVTSIYKMHDIKYLGVAIAASVLWSPFALLGIFPYTILLGIRYFSPKNSHYILNLESFIMIIVAFWTGGIWILYIASNKFSFPMTFIWNDIKDSQILLITLLQFWFLEFGFLAFLSIGYFTLNFDKHQEKKKIFNPPFPLYFNVYAVSILILVFLPFLKMGIYNDIVMRSSIPALFIFWAVISKILIDRPKRGKQYKFNALYTVILVTVLVGFFSSFVEITRSVENYQFGPPFFYDIRELGNENNTTAVMQRVGKDDTFFYHYLAK